MGQLRWTRLTNGFSKKWENHSAAIMLWYCYYNFCRVHKSIRVTTAMEAGITGHVWSIAELLGAANSTLASAREANVPADRVGHLTELRSRINGLYGEVFPEPIARQFEGRSSRCPRRFERL